MDRREFEEAQRRAKVEHDRLRHTRLASTLAAYLDRRGAYVHRQQHPGDGSGVPDGHFRICIEVEAPLFWRIYGELERRQWLRRRDGMFIAVAVLALVAVVLIAMTRRPARVGADPPAPPVDLAPAVR